jgi:hypothetical protein
MVHTEHCLLQLKQDVLLGHGLQVMSKYMTDSWSCQWWLSTSLSPHFFLTWLLPKGGVPVYMRIYRQSIVSETAGSEVDSI